MNNETLTLDTYNCAKVALYMYEEYKKAMQPPVYRVLSFEEWLEKIMENTKDGK